LSVTFNSVCARWLQEFFWKFKSGFCAQSGELTLPPHFSSFFPQRPRRFAPDFRPGIFIVQAERGSVSRSGRQF
jgi:hypothetical protein